LGLLANFKWKSYQLQSLGLINLENFDIKFDFIGDHIKKLRIYLRGTICRVGTVMPLTTLRLQLWPGIQITLGRMCHGLFVKFSISSILSAKNYNCKILYQQLLSFETTLHVMMSSSCTYLFMQAVWEGDIDDQNWHQPVWLVCPNGLTSLLSVAGLAGADLSDRSMRSPSTIREFYRFRSANRIS